MFKRIINVVESEEWCYGLLAASLAILGYALTLFI